MTLNVNLTPKLEDVARDRLKNTILETLRQDILTGLNSGRIEDLEIEDIKRRGRSKLDQL